MKKLKKPKKPKLPLKLRRKKSTEQKVSDALSDVPRITNETVGEHREEMLSSARKYIYPLEHSKHRVVRISISLLVLAVVLFFAGVGLALYKFQATSGFIYDVTRVIPFPVAKTGDKWVSYESYLFELRRNMHYYHTQQRTDFSTKDGKTQLKRLKQQAMRRVVQDSYVKQLADKNHVRVSGRAVSGEIALLEQQNRLGGSSHALRDSLSAFFGWSEADFRRELRQELLTQAVVAKLDTATNDRAHAVLQQLHKKKPADFGKLAAKVSDDPNTRNNGGQYPGNVTINSSQIPPAVTAEVFKLKKGQVSGIINTGYSLDVVKLLSRKGGSAKAAHIQFNFQLVTKYVKPLQDKHPPHYYIKF